MTAPRPFRDISHNPADCAVCGTATERVCGECWEPVCGPCFTNMHLQQSGCFGVYDNDGEPSWFGLASDIARRQS